MKNAIRDSAEWAWIPTGTTCAFCITLASGGWQRASKKALKGGHAEHIHANCDCTYAVRFNSQDNVYGCTHERYKLIYDSMQGKTTDGKMKALRRSLTGKNSLTLEQLEFILKLENSPSILGQKTPAEWAKYLRRSMGQSGITWKERSEKMRNREEIKSDLECRLKQEAKYEMIDGRICFCTIVKQMDTFFKDVFMERQNYSCLSM